MTVIEIMPTSRWRDSYPAPKDVALANGPWCPMSIRTPLLTERHGWVCVHCGAYWDRDGRHGRWLTADMLRLVDGCLIERTNPAPAPSLISADAPAVTGDLVHPADLTLPAPAAPWWRTRPGLVAAGIGGALVLGGGYAAGRACRPYADTVPETLLWSLSLIIVGLLTAGAGLLLGWRWWTGRTGGGAA